MVSQRERQLDLLRIVSCMAWADGDVSDQERRLLEKLVTQYFTIDNSSSAPEEATQQLAAWRQDDSSLEEVVKRLDQLEDRLLVLKLANMMARVSQRPEDSSAINPEEKVVYRRLVDVLGLDEVQVKEAEWAAERELSEGKGIWAVLGTALSGLGAWPTTEMLETPGMQWL
ncbi:MAG: TerB family tellurite resistance protein [Cyanobium sp.]